MISRINEHIEYHKSIDSHKSDVAFLEEVKRYINKLEANKMDKQEFNEGHIAEALDRVNIIIGMIDDLLVDHPGIVKTGQGDHVGQAAESLMEAYQNIGGYGVEP